MDHISVLSMSTDEFLAEVDIEPGRATVSDDECRKHYRRLPTSFSRIYWPAIKRWACFVLDLEPEDVYLENEPIGHVLA